MVKIPDPQEQAMRRIRLQIGLAVGLVVLAIVAGGLLYSFGLGGPSLAEGEAWTAVDKPLPEADDQPISVVEFFSYGCVHCAAFDPQLAEWVEDLPDDVQFRRVPAAFSPEWRLLASAYLTLEAAKVVEDNHERTFTAIHERGRRFTTVDDLAGFYDGEGITAEEFRFLHDSAEIRRATGLADRMTQRMGVMAVPTLVVAGRYRINVGDVGRVGALEVAEALIEQERARRAAARGGAAGAASGND